MRLVVVEGPADVLDLAEVKAHVRVADFDDDDALLRVYARAAERHLAGPDGWLGRSIGMQTLELRLPAFCPEIPLPCPPIVALSSIAYTDLSGAEQTVAPSFYRLRDRVVSLAPGASWPATATDDEAVRLRFAAGFAAGEAPRPLVLAMLLLVSHWYANREAVVIGGPVSALPFAVEALASPYRCWI